VLDGLDLDLPPGRRVALIGPSGAGKSTVAAVLLRFRDPVGGSVTLNGADLAGYAAEAVRAVIGGCPQDPHIFDGNIRDNLRLARALHRRGIPVIYYVSPQLWAWRRGRIDDIRDSVARMLVIFPFEEQLYRDAGVPVTFVGHPLVSLVRPATDPLALRRELGLDPERPVVALLPGSRPKEVAHNLPPIAASVDALATARPELQFVAAVAASLDPDVVRGGLGGRAVTVVHDRTHAALSAATAAIVASGTATVEAALESCRSGEVVEVR
jgi:hypothetical protein